jgi:hypothetical protein
LPRLVTAAQDLDLFFRCGISLETQGIQGGSVVAKTLAKLTIGIAALAAATWFGTSSSQAYGPLVRSN